MIKNALLFTEKCEVNLIRHCKSVPLLHTSGWLPIQRVIPLLWSLMWFLTKIHQPIKNKMVNWVQSIELFWAFGVLLYQFMHLMFAFDHKSVLDLCRLVQCYTFYLHVGAVFDFRSCLKSLPLYIFVFETTSNWHDWSADCRLTQPSNEPLFQINLKTFCWRGWRGDVFMEL